MKPIEGYNKLRGGYYTPDKISEFIAEWAIRKTSDSVLEPSCGDGSFLSAITTRYRELGATDEQIRNNVLGIELDDVEAEKAVVLSNDNFTEVASVILQVGYFKITHGKRIFKMAPIHHHFEKCGWSEVKIVGVFTLITVIACVLAYLGL